jgi:ComF family protein
MIGRFKFRGDFACGRVIGNLLAERFSCYYSGPTPHDADRRPPDLLVPVPLHRRRLRSRGFNQALELARVVSRRCDITLAGDLVRKTRETAPQSQLSATGRVHNLRGAFTVAGVPHAENRLRVALIDDVVTTGSTARALAAVLKRAGISRVDVWAVSRAA